MINSSVGAIKKPDMTISSCLLNLPEYFVNSYDGNGSSSNVEEILGVKSGAAPTLT